jgi:ubiquinone/menaquinone biosynthesis C-methylase UbiE
MRVDKAELFTDGQAYERMMGRWSRLAGKIFLEWLDIPKGVRWLDVGCGNGAFTEEIIACRAPVAVTAIDPSEDQLAFARTRSGAKLAKFELGDAQKLTLGRDTFDVATMALVLAFLVDPAKAVSEMTRVVRPGGWVAAYMWDIPNGGAPTTPIYTAIESLGSTLPVRPNAAASRLQAMRGFWEMAGLEAIETRVLRIPVKYADFNDFWDSNTVPVGPQGKVIAGMSHGAREQLRERLREQLPVNSDGQIAYESFANAVHGRVRV